MHFMRMECVWIMELIILIIVLTFADDISYLIKAKADEIRTRARMLKEREDDDDNS